MYTDNSYMVTTTTPNTLKPGYLFVAGIISARVRNCGFTSFEDEKRFTKLKLMLDGWGDFLYTLSS